MTSNLNNPPIPFSVVTEPVRALDTEYQNTDAKPRLVMVSVNSAASSAVIMHCGPATGPTDHVATVGNGNLAGVTIMLVCVIPPGYFYNLTVTAGVPTISEWFEAI